MMIQDPAQYILYSNDLGGDVVHVHVQYIILQVRIVPILEVL